MQDENYNALYCLRLYLLLVE